MDSEFKQLQEISRDEAWLAPQGTPAPSDAAVNRLRAAIRAELARAGSGGASRWKSWHGAVAAAAMLAVVATLGWRGGSAWRERGAAPVVTLNWPGDLESEQYALAEFEGEALEMEYYLGREESGGGRGLYDAWVEAVESPALDRDAPPRR